MNIDRNIPLPAGRGGRELMFPWPKMQIGDSLIVKGERGRMQALRSWRRWADRNNITGRKVTTRAASKGNVRVWLVAKEAA